jgi:hypothetical protein
VPAAYGPPRRLWGTRPGRVGAFTVIAGTVLGALITVISGSEPGWALGVLLVISTAAGALVVTRRAAYLVIPVPILAYTVAAFVTGYIHDRSIDTSKTALAVSAVQWIADGFFAMTAATLVAIVIVVGRWLFTGPGSRRAYGDSPASRAFRSIWYRPAGGLGTAGQERGADAGGPPAAEPQPGAESSPSAGSAPTGTPTGTSTGPRHSA